MDIVGTIQAAKQTYQLGEPITLTLVLENRDSDPTYLFVPKGRAGGIEIEVKQGNNFQIKNMLNEAEPGLQAELKLGAGETLRQQISLSDWLIVREPGSYIVAVTIPIEAGKKSLREDDAKGASRAVSIQASVHFTIVAKGSS